MAGLYIHIPFCKSKCVYCGFYSTVNSKGIDDFLDALTKEMDLQCKGSDSENFQTIYFGGGTPSFLQPFQLQRIMDGIRNHFDIADNAEITIEANPEQLTADYCTKLKILGFNRLSIGIQSFHDEILRFLGRRHSAKEALLAVENAHAAGFDNLSIDLIYGVNERDNDLWEKELNIAFSLPIRHFSAYALTVEENSLLYKHIQHHRKVEPDEELAANQYDILCESVAKSRFSQYEVSNFAVPGGESKHNSAYWMRIPYLGLGPAAHSFDGLQRSWNAPTLSAYFSQIKERRTFFERETLTDTDRYNEYLLLRLRTREGIDLQEMSRMFGPERTASLLCHFKTEVPNEFYEHTDEKIHLTSKGLWFADGIAGDAFL